MVNWSAINQKWNSLGGNLAAELELMIVRGELPQGEKIPPERELAATLGVSRATLREALLELEIKGLLSRRPGRGTIVLETPTESQFQQLSEAFTSAQQDFSQVMEMRLTIEPAVARLAAAKATAADIRKLEQILAESEIETSSMKLLELDQTFHVALSDIARNPLLSDLIRIVGDWAGASRRLGFQGGKRKEASLHGHWQIVDALRAGQPDLAENAMREHIAGIQNLIAPTPGELQGNS